MAEIAKQLETSEMVLFKNALMNTNGEKMGFSKNLAYQLDNCLDGKQTDGMSQLFSAGIRNILNPFFQLVLLVNEMPESIKTIFYNSKFASFYSGECNNIFEEFISKLTNVVEDGNKKDDVVAKILIFLEEVGYFQLHNELKKGLNISNDDTST